MSGWTTRFAVLAEHIPAPGWTPLLSAAHCQLVVIGKRAVLACQREGNPDIWSVEFAPEAAPILLGMHDAVVPRLRLLPAAEPIDLRKQLRMFNAEVERAG